MFTSTLMRRVQRHNVAALVGLSTAHYFIGLHPSNQTPTCAEPLPQQANSTTNTSTSAAANSTHTAETSETFHSSSSSSSSSSSEEELFENQCLKRQMHVPKVPYPAWDYNWDGRETEATSLEGHRRGLQKNVVGSNKYKTRHIILIRHGQYDESPKDDDRRTLTPLGRLQALRTGRRLKEMMMGTQTFPTRESRGPCRIKAIHVSDMTRAKETAELLAAELGMSVCTPDADLNEALPAPMIPIRPDIPHATEEIDQNRDRIERAFQRYFYRDAGTSIDDGSGQQGSDEPPLKEDDKDDLDEFEIIVCHGT
jgi:serine/threonine-protein phosphatase PGAM5